MKRRSRVVSHFCRYQLVDVSSVRTGGGASLAGRLSNSRINFSGARAAKNGGKNLDGRGSYYIVPNHELQLEHPQPLGPVSCAGRCSQVHHHGRRVSPRSGGAGHRRAVPSSTLSIGPGHRAHHRVVPILFQGGECCIIYLFALDDWRKHISV